MCGYHPSQILDKLGTAIVANPEAKAEPLSIDRWVLASALQKAIRRGEVDTALRAATGFWQADRLRFWKRLHVIALEDIGIANPELLVTLLTATNASHWRRRVGDIDVALHLVKQLCLSAKCRLADETYILAETSPEYAAARTTLAQASGAALTDAVLDDARPLAERMLALWYIAGTKRFHSDHLPMREGEIADAIEVLRMLDAPAELTESCIAVIMRAPWPLAMFNPLFYAAIQPHKNAHSITTQTIPPSPSMDGIPFYALDMFTRVGLASYRQLRNSVSELRGYSPKQIGLAMFYREGWLCDQLLQSESLAPFRKQGEFADIESAGMCVPSYLALQATLDEHEHTLQAIRKERLKTYLSEAAWLG